ncbi:MAG: lysostaphin resistance A-like protein [Egibacteraceae bacterium]
MACTPLHRWWRPLVGTLVLACAYLVFQLVLALPLTLALRRIMNLSAISVALMMGLPATLLAAWWVQRRPIGSLSSVAGHLRRGWLLVCAGAAMSYLVVLLVTWAMMLDQNLVAPSGGEWVGWQRFLIPAVVLAVLVPLDAAAQEYVFRGWVLQAFGAYLRNPWPGIVISAALFSLMHPAARQSLSATAYYGLFGIVMGSLTIRTGGVEAGLALHTVHNLVLLVPAAAVGFVNTSTSGQADWAAVPWLRLTVGQATALAVFAALILWLARRRGLATATATATATGPQH